ncbi:hypothetical protein PHMEG_00018769 [Phytophthora megakarya]|uniref:Reverse transcriptase domain-containing protein n=1 Tax=Phytophthora megakarya TaxID=4795 RepID=A0A225VUJ8_9STRA|nr:hypothetical protein PHMEG_00018769 [Phytophthora megakarya]
MVTPRSVNRKARVAREAEQTESMANTRSGTGRNSSRRQAPADDSSSDEGNPFYQDDYENDATIEMAWQIRELTAMEEMDPTPRFEITQHRPLGKITPFRGKLDESENSMQWLRGFVYEMKDKFTSYYCSQFSQSASSRYYRAKRSEKEHIRDYLNRLNGYARSASVKFEHSGREAKEHLRDIHALEDIVSDIQKVEKQVVMKLTRMSVTAIVVRNTRSKRILTLTKTRDWLQLLTTTNVEMLLTGHLHGVTSVPKTTDNSQVDLVKVDFDLRLNLVHDFGKCEAFDELAEILRTNADKKNTSPELQKLSANLVIDAEFLYAFTGKCEWPKDSNNNDENKKNVEFNGGWQIKQRARRIPLRHLQKLYELLKGLLKAGLIAFSDIPWASPIVIVLKKNGQDNRVCIDYKMVNAVTANMEYAMPLVDDLLIKLENYLWFCSLNATSGFWAIMMTMRGRKTSAIVCALEHFEWLRMPFGLKNSPMIYQRMIDNALWGFVQPNDFTLTTTRTKFEADRQASSELDSVLRMVNNPYTDMFTTNEPEESLLVPVFQRRSFVDAICFGATTFDDCLGSPDKLLARFEECRISASFTKNIFCQSKVNFLSHEVSPEGIQADPKKMTAFTKLPFPKSKK